MAQCQKINEFIKTRRKNFLFLKIYYLTFLNILYYQKKLVDLNPSWFGFPITIKKSSKINREHLLEFLEKNNVGTRLFGGNITHQPYMLNKQYRVSGSLRVSDIIMQQSFWDRPLSRFKKAKPRIYK